MPRRSIMSVITPESRAEVLPKIGPSIPEPNAGAN